MTPSKKITHPSHPGAAPKNSRILLTQLQQQQDANKLFEHQSNASQQSMWNEQDGLQRETNALNMLDDQLEEMLQQGRAGHSSLSQQHRMMRSMRKEERDGCAYSRIRIN